jgi:polyhydroxyalkanoate synthesis regulator phasin
MKISRRNKVIVGAVAVVATAGTGAAVASSNDSSRSAESKAIIDDAAKQLGIPSSKLSDALKKALSDRVDAAVAAGRITKAEGDALKQRIQSEDFPLIGGLHRGFGHFGFFGRFEAAASYIGITQAQLRTELQNGKSLAQVAQDHGKTADGLISALVADAKQKLDNAVAAGRLTKAQADEMLSDLKDRITNLVNATGLPGPRFRDHEGFRRFGGPFS